MVKVTEKYLIRRLAQKPQILRRKRGEADKEYLNRVTHLQLQSQFVDHIAPMANCTSVSVIYLQNNQLQTIHNMTNFPNLTYLYLQNNHITKIENLNCLKHLKKLYLGSNEISVLEGLNELDNLIELHMESQRLAEGETIYFDPRTVKNLGKSLKVLNINQNNITSLHGLSGLTKLEELTASDNKLDDFDEILDSIGSLPKLQKLALRGNPIASDRKYRETIIISSASLRILDDKNVSSETRTFIENLAMKKEKEELKSGAPKMISRSFSDTKSQSMPQSLSGSKLFPLLKMQMMHLPRTVSTFSKTVSPQYFHQSLQAFECGSSRVDSGPN